MLTIEYANSPIWANAEHTLINLMVKFVEFTDVLPFTASPTDDMSYGKELFTNAVNGDYETISDYIPPPQPIEPTTENQPISTGTQSA